MSWARHGRIPRESPSASAWLLPETFEQIHGTPPFRDGFVPSVSRKKVLEFIAERS
jgi:hypothetical protein